MWRGRADILPISINMVIYHAERGTLFLFIFFIFYCSGSLERTLASEEGTRSQFTTDFGHSAFSISKMLNCMVFFENQAKLVKLCHLGTFRSWFSMIINYVSWNLWIICGAKHSWSLLVFTYCAKSWFQIHFKPRNSDHLGLLSDCLVLKNNK